MIGQFLSESELSIDSAGGYGTSILFLLYFFSGFVRIDRVFFELLSSNCQCEILLSQFFLD